MYVCVCMCVCVCVYMCIPLTMLVDVVLCLCLYVYCLSRHFPGKTWSIKNLSIWKILAAGKARKDVI